jgi:penicillin-binding protein 2
MRKQTIGPRFLLVLLLAASLPAMAAAGQVRKRVTTHKRIAATHSGVPTFADSAKDDVTINDDPLVRQAAVAALGRYNGSVVAIDPSNGRILSIVNQKLAFSTGFKPCSTIKPVIAVAALQEGLITRDTLIRVTRRKSLNLSEALAHSNNPFFEELGRRMGFDVVSGYARLLGLGELSGYAISEEQTGAVPGQPPKRGGVARMSSFGEGIRMTPLHWARSFPRSPMAARSTICELSKKRKISNRASSAHSRLRHSSRT